MRVNTDFTIDISDDDEKAKNMFISAVGIFQTDYNYGADADGNRGEIQTNMTDWNYKVSLSKDSQDIFDELTEDERSKVGDAVEENLWNEFDRRD